MLRLRSLALGTALALIAVLTATVAGGGASAVSLSRGWNNVSYLGAAKSPVDALAPISGQYSSVYRWDAGAQAYQLYAPGAPAFANTLAQLNTGDAIWLAFTADTGSLNTGSVGQVPTTGGTGKLSIAGSTFQPMSDLAIYQKSFNQIGPVNTDADSQRYFAPVTLPQGATITSMTVAFVGAGDTVKVRLDYTPLANGDASASVFKLAEVLSSGGASPQTVQAFSHQVDNGANVYVVVADLTGGSASKLMGVSIAYTY
jgi:hypothetical protein